LLFNIYQAVYYGILVQRLYVHYTMRLEKYDIDTVQLKLEWARKNYLLALIMCSTVILSCLFKNIIIDCILTILLCLYYFFFALMHMQYKSIFTSLDPAFAGGLFQGNSSDYVYDDENQKNIFNWQKARHYIINQKLYLQSGITVNKLSEFFHTNRTSFSSAVNKNEGQSFSMFINQLRMVEAKEILVENPEKTLSEIAQHCGYTEQSNFTRQFRQLCGETPAAWKEKNKKCGYENL
jgi:AraC-like DNA-binding protein